MDKKIRTRFAPSPTGNLHVGGARTALFNYAFAKKMGGDFLLRIDDTDADRNVSGSADKVMRDLLWLGLDWDHGPMLDGSTKGDVIAYRQSDRLDIYHDHAKKLVDKGLAYYCFLSDDFDGDKTLYRNFDPVLALDKIKKGDSYCIRFKTPVDTDVVIFDLIRGKVSFNTNVINDFVLIRSNGLPTYNFATVIDDHLMDITHVIRADEHLNNTLPQKLVYDALSWDAPKFAHLSLIFGSDGKKLSKRHGASSVGDFKDGGYLPGALVNYLSLLGWSHPKGKDVFPLKDLVDNFSLKKVNPSPAIFDGNKLLWMNGVYLRNLDKTSVVDLLKDLNPPTGIDLNKVVDLYKTNAFVLTDYLKVFSWYKDDFDFKLDDDAKTFLKDNPSSLDVIKNYITWFDTDISFKDFTDNLKMKGFSTKVIFWTLRISAIATPHGPDNFGLVDTLPKSVLKDRAFKTLNALL